MSRVRVVEVPLSSPTPVLEGKVQLVDRTLWQLLDPPHAKPRYGFVVVHTYITPVGQFCETIAYKADAAGEIVDHRCLCRWANRIAHPIAMRRAGFREVAHASV